MAVRKLWSQLKPGTRARKLKFYAKQGLSPRQIARRYNSGKLGPQAAARGHAQTPEHGLQEALKKPNIFRRYLRRKERIIGGGPGKAPDDEDIARERNRLLDNAYRSMSRLRQYVYYNDTTVQANIYGGETSESGQVPGMSNAQASWTASADIEAIRSMASEQYRGNPWWYH